MWERSARQNPLSMRYQQYLDHRPVLAQDPTGDWLHGRHSSYVIYYYLINGRSFLCSNNVPVNDRKKLEALVNFRSYFYNNIKSVGLIPALFLSTVLFKNVKIPYKILYPILFYGLYKFSSLMIANFFEVKVADNISYFFHKYKHLTVTDLNSIKDPRRQHFRVDTSTYYRQSPEDVLHASHGHHAEDHGEHAHHDTSDYYGPYPYNDFENTDHLMEINKKFTTGKSVFDDKDHEFLLGEKVDVNRFVPGLPTAEDYRNI